MQLKHLKLMWCPGYGCGVLFQGAQQFPNAFNGTYAQGYNFVTTAYIPVSDVPPSWR